MANVQYFDVLLRPVLTEKSMADMATKKYTFMVHPDANKIMIKEAIEKLFPGAKVQKVNTMNLDGKTKTRNVGGKFVKGTSPAQKKAIVQLTADSKDLDIVEGL